MVNVSLAIKDLQVGHYINLPIGWTSHPFILNSFLIKDAKQLRILQHLSLETVSVDLSRSKIAQTPTSAAAPASLQPTQNVQASAEALAQQAVFQKREEQHTQLSQQQAWWKQIRHTRSKYQEKIVILKNIYSKLSLQPEKAMELLELLSGELTIASEQQHDFSFVLCNEEISSDTLYQNAMNVAVLSTRLAQQLAFSRQDIAIITQTALLSQFGMLWVPASIRNKKSELTKPEVNYLKQHPAYAAQRLQGIDSLPDIVVHSILQVNEKFDGSGYPRGFKQDKISKYAQLIAITTRYNEMCNANLPQHRYSPHLAIGLLFKVANKHYNKAYLEQFIKMIGIYPVGTIVSYDNNQALVQMSIIDSLRHPLIVDFNELEPIKKQPLLRDCGDDDIAITKAMSSDNIDPAHSTKFNLAQRCNLYFPS
ncbi:HD-GYP domain-containing protein [Moritella dasanensis]|uniref:HD-GYP domain-containing protein n=1 Tax=Moritella dasanensis TaxID=428031 RepID=UPI0002F784BA|nr:HD-GYP domain-containing protein [Moritella dasanensis]